MECISWPRCLICSTAGLAFDISGCGALMKERTKGFVGALSLLRAGHAGLPKYTLFPTILGSGQRGSPKGKES